MENLPLMVPMSRSSERKKSQLREQLPARGAKAATRETAARLPYRLRTSTSHVREGPRQHFAPSQVIIIAVVTGDNVSRFAYARARLGDGLPIAPIVTVVRPACPPHPGPRIPPSPSAEAAATAFAIGVFTSVFDRAPLLRIKISEKKEASKSRATAARRCFSS
jgi:hypothetical protein